MTPRRYILLLGATVVVGAGLGQSLWWAIERTRPKPDIRSLLPDISGEYELVDHTGRLRTDRDFRGKVQIVFFGFTNCPDVCPTGLGYIAAALDGLGTHAADFQTIFITVDPQRDTPAQLAAYVGNFHPSFIGLSGTAEQTARAAAGFRVIYAKANIAGPDSYTMDHTATITLLDRAGRFAGTLDTHEKLDVAIEKLRLVAVRAGGS